MDQRSLLREVEEFVRRFTEGGDAEVPGTSGASGGSTGQRHRRSGLPVAREQHADAFCQDRV